jgi:hypothetical protein
MFRCSKRLYKNLSNICCIRKSLDTNFAQSIVIVLKGLHLVEKHHRKHYAVIHTLARAQDCPSMDYLQRED